MQLELFNWEDPDVFLPISGPPRKTRTKKKKRQYVDYDMLYKMLLTGPITFKQIEEVTGVSHCGVAQVITTLSIRYPIWSPARGVYKLCEDSDYE